VFSLLGEPFHRFSPSFNVRDPRVASTPAPAASAGMSEKAEGADEVAQEYEQPAPGRTEIPYNQQ
jgi:hypothetical protein